MLNEGYGWKRASSVLWCCRWRCFRGWFAGKVDKSRCRRGSPTRRRYLAAVAAKIAFGNASFVVMTLAYSSAACSLVFITTHLPSYLAICGMDPMLSAQTLGVIGGFNVLGSLFFGWAGGRWNKLALLGGIYIFRSLALAWYFMLRRRRPRHCFWRDHGFLWLGVGPLVAGAVADLSGCNGRR